LHKRLRKGDKCRCESHHAVTCGTEGEFKMHRLLLSTILALLLPASLVRAEPISLQLTIDELLRGRAVLSGSLDDTPGGTFVGTAVGTHWQLLSVNFGVENFVSFGLISVAQHLSAPHPGEMIPGALLNVFQTNLSGAGEGPVGPQTASVSVLHPGSTSDFDVLTSSIEDLNGGAPGFLGAGNRISATFDMVHTPEPATLLLLGSGMVVAARMARKRRKAD
jgi:hypothetical protein